jgi:small-conductance mechanosensitive channel
VSLLDPIVAQLVGLPAWQATLLVLLLSFGGAVVVEVVVLRGCAVLVARTGTRADDIVFRSLRFPVVVTVALAGIYVLTEVPAVRAGVLLTPTQLETFFGNPALSVIVLVWAWSLNAMVNRLATAATEGDRPMDFAPVVSNVWTILLLSGSLGLLLTIWGVDVTPLLAGAGIAGIAIGFAAKDIVANFFGGIALFIDDTYRIGDYVVLDTGQAGTVVKVGVRSTTLLTRDEVLVTVPNAVLNATTVTNQTAPDRRKRIRVPVGVAYGSDLDEFEALALEVATDERLVLESPEPRIRFRSFGDSALEYELLGWVKSPIRAARATHELNRALYARMGEAGIDIPFPQREIAVRTTAAAGPGDAVGRATPDQSGNPATDGGHRGDQSAIDRAGRGHDSPSREWPEQTRGGDRHQ